MKRITLTLLSLLLIAEFASAGGLVTNTNQSTAWTRMLIRDATTDIDAVFYNPAGLVKLNDGFHISLSNQSVFQTQTITSNYQFLNSSPKEYVGDISAPLFPSLYLAYKTGRWAFSIGVNVVGGGGGAEFNSGVPMMEVPISNLVPQLEPLGVTGYNVEMAFSGRSAYWGIQAGASFEITKNVSVFAGARYVIAKNTYEGYMRNITVATPGGDLPPSTYVQGVSDDAAAGAASANGAADGMKPIIDGGGSDFTLAQLEGAGFIDATQKAQLEGGLLALGLTQEEIDAMNAGQIQGAYYTAGSELTATSQYLAGQAAYLGIVTADQVADITQTGNGITPILGVNLSFLDDDLNIGIKYEFNTKLELTNSTPAGKGFVTGVDSTGQPIEMFPDGEKTNADIPALLSVGIEYRIIDPLMITVGYHGYFDKQTGWAKEADEAGQPTIDNNFFEIGLGLQYDINDNFLVSIGYLHANSGVNKYYQSDLDYSLNSNTIGLGGAWAINDTFKLQLGGYIVTYDKGTYDYEDATTGMTYQNSYLKSTWALSLGLDIAIGSKKN